MRRDDRAEPDEEGSSPRVDVVNIDRPGGGGGGSIAPRGEGATAGMVSLKAQLAKLHEQAAAAQKSLDDQRRDRSDALDQLERATERCIHLEAKAATFEAEALSLQGVHEALLSEAQGVRADRDGLAVALEAAKVTRAELEAANQKLQDTLEESMRAGGTLEDELADLRKRQFQQALKVTDQETGLAALRAKLERAHDETGEARAESASAKDDVAKAADALARLARDLAAARSDNASDRATARDRIDAIERDLDEARAATARTGTDLEASRAKVETLTTQLEAAAARVAHSDTRAEAAERRAEAAEARAAHAEARSAEAEARATVASASHTTLVLDIERLREEIAAAFGRMNGAVPAPSVRRPQTEAQPEPGTPSTSIPAPTYASVPPQVHEAAASGAPTKP